MHTLNSIITTIFFPVMLICAAAFLVGLIIIAIAPKKQDKTEHEQMLKQAKIMTLLSGFIFCVGFGWCIHELSLKTLH
ncbi:hypothetical protein [Psychrobacter sp. I-STPA10]|uniref:hypothetical protein n=1 Tax=Psychrobacter sp. I-STPA10 TaxID=2585769 RepID=UPI001E551983|nr:hypothetical protein [Psychrobacter sp. I-STPA10]